MVLPNAVSEVFWKWHRFPEWGSLRSQGRVILRVQWGKGSGLKADGPKEYQKQQLKSSSA
eukprot:5000251-Amphidinium_carterae.1